MHALTGEGRGAVGVEGGTATRDVGEAVDQVKQALVDAGPSPAAKIPDVDKQVVLFQSDELEKVRKGAHVLDVIGNREGPGARLRTRFGAWPLCARTPWSPRSLAARTGYRAPVAVMTVVS